MIKHHPASRIISVGLVLLTLLISLLVTTRFVSVTHAATHVPLTQYGLFPVSVIGKVIIDFTSYVYDCTGTALISANESVVETAAHCFYDNNGRIVQATSVEFCPQYHIQQKPRGCWTGKQIFVPSAFHWVATPTSSSYINDYAFLVVSKRSDGKTLQSVVNGAKPTFSSITATEKVTVYGYVNDELYSSTGGATTVAVPGGNILRLSVSNLREGGSGGPWFIPLGENVYFVGHSSGYNHTSGDISSPILSRQWSSLFEHAANVQ